MNRPGDASSKNYVRLFVVVATGIIFVTMRTATCTRINPNMNYNTYSTKIIMAIRRQQAYEGGRVRVVFDYVFSSKGSPRPTSVE
ncbi:hypothetical protein BDR04DRAFT_1100676 [Suillus decipiens]|nr:hypothetical protein BDR04DRAFT_1100676 [Suillus decipiens]